MIPTLSLEPFSSPVPVPIVALVVGITPASSGGVLVVLAGVGIGGSSAVFSDLNGLSAYTAKSGFDTRGARGGRITKLLHGNEDNDWRRA